MSLLTDDRIKKVLRENKIGAAAAFCALVDRLIDSELRTLRENMRTCQRHPTIMQAVELALRDELLFHEGDGNWEIVEALEKVMGALSDLRCAAHEPEDE